MKKLFLLLIAAQLFLSYDMHGRVITLKGGETVTVRKGDTMLISTYANFYDGGYRDSVAYNRNIFKQLNWSPPMNPTEKPQPGGRVPYTISFKAIKKGQDVMTMYVFRSFEKGKPKKIYFSSAVIVK